MVLLLWFLSVKILTKHYFIRGENLHFGKIIAHVHLSGMEDVNRRNEIEYLTVSKEALVSKENIGDDGIGDEDWNVISTQR